jgi:hypothetical protein
MSPKALLSTSLAISLVGRASAITIGFGTVLTGVQDTQSNGANNQMRQNINITDTVFLEAGTYHATTWDYQAGADSGTAGVTQPVFPFLTIVNGPANHTVLAFGDTIDTEPGTQNDVPFGGNNDTFTIPAGGATVAAGIQNPSEIGVQNSILTDTSFGRTDHANSGNFDEAGGVGNALDSFGHANLARTYAFSIEVEAGVTTDGDGDGLPTSWETANGLDDTDDGTVGESAAGLKDGPNGPLGDPDNDGLSNADELANNTDPQDPDSDGDTINDNDELTAGTNPNNADSDGDGLNDAEEATLGTDPTEADSDGDGINDGAEILLGSDPNDPNSPAFNGIGPGVNITNATIQDIQNGERLNVSLRFTNLAAGSYDVSDWLLNVHTHTIGSVTPMLLTGVPPSYTTLWIGSPYDPTDNGIQAVPESGSFTLDADTDVYAGFFTTELGSGIIALDINNSGTGTHATDHDNAFTPPSMVGDQVGDFSHANLGRSYAFEITVGSGSGPRKVPLSVTQVGSDLVFTWTSQAGMRYDLLSEIDPSVAMPIDWPVYDGHEQIMATPGTNTLTIPLPAESERFFVIKEYPAPPVPIYEENFDTTPAGSLPAGWTIRGSPGNPPGTNWELGTPSTVGPPTAFGGSNCVGTNIAAPYTLNANIFLRSPVIDLVTAVGATLNFAHWVDIEEGFDFGSVAVLDATDNSELGFVVSVVDGDLPSDWEQFSMSLPAAALGKNVIFEFRLFEDGVSLLDQAGWYIDNVVVTVPGS